MTIRYKDRKNAGGFLSTLMKSLTFFLFMGIFRITLFIPKYMQNQLKSIIILKD